MGQGWMERALRVGVAVGIVALAWSSLKVIGISWLGSSEPDLERGRRLVPSNAAFAQALARKALLRGEASEALRLAEEAIRVFPYRGSAWLDLAEARLKMGDREGALRAAQTASMLGPSKGKWRWRAARLLLQAGWVEQGAAELAAVARMDASRRHDAYDLAWTVFGEQDFVLRRIVPQDPKARLDYLYYLMARQRVGAAVQAWAVAKWAASRAQRLSYVDFLLAQGEVEEAWRVWRDMFPEASVGSIQDESFEAAPVGYGFGWRVGGTQGAAARIEGGPQGGERALVVEFSGENPDFNHGYQIVRVEEERKYRLRARVRWEGVTSASPPRLFVRDYRGCAGLNVASAGFKGSGGTLVELDFATPAGCRAVVVGLERQRTHKLDRNITGKVFLTRVELSVVPAKAAVPGRSAAGQLEGAKGAADLSPAPPALNAASGGRRMGVLLG